MIYLDHAATAPMKKDVLDAMLPYFTSAYANASGSYSAARKARSAMDAARAQLAAALGAKRSEIYFTSGGSEADNWALFGAVRAGKKKRVVTTAIEHHAILEACKALEQEGIEVVYAPVDPTGKVDPHVIRAMLTENTAIVSVMLANNEVGTIQPVAQIAKIAHEYGALMHTDAVQAVGHIPIDVRELGVDLLSLSAHKFGGPKGIGALYIKQGTRLANLIYGGAQEKGMRAGTENLPGIVGMGKAIQLAHETMPAASERVCRLRNRLEEKIVSEIPRVHINGDRKNRLPGHLHISIPDVDANMLLMRLDMEGIAASSASACAAGAMERSHVIRAMGLAGANQADLRLTLGEDNTEEEIETTVSALRRILLR